MQRLGGYIYLFALGGVLVFDVVARLGHLLQNPFGLVGLAIGVAGIAVVGMTRRGLVKVTVGNLILATMFALLYRLFVYVFEHSIADTLVLPRYIPVAWFAVTAALGSGLLLGAGLPALLFLMVSEGFDLLGQEAD